MPVPEPGISAATALPPSLAGAIAFRLTQTAPQPTGKRP